MDQDHEDQESGNENDEGDADDITDRTINIRDIRHSLQDDTEYENTYSTSGSNSNKFDGRNRKSRQKFSQVWTKFTIVDNKDCLATCNICGARLSYKTTITNLSKHIMRKHNYNAKGFKVVPFQQKKTRVQAHVGPSGRDHKRTLTELGGLDNLLLNVVADEGEDPLEVVSEEVTNEQVVYAEEVGEYTYTLGTSPEEGHMKNKTQTPTRSSTSERRNLGLEAKKERMIDLQLECLELKKYNMQLEALSMEQQLSMPRSIFTEPLRGSNNTTRGTQTEVGGGNTKVFYVSDKNIVNGDQSSAQLFTFQARVND